MGEDHRHAMSRLKKHGHNTDRLKNIDTQFLDREGFPFMTAVYGICNRKLVICSMKSSLNSIQFK